MNFFFGFNSNFIKCKLTIPKFKNREKISKKLCLYTASVSKNQEWIIKKMIDDEDEEFFYINNENIDNKEIYFISTIDNPEEGLHKQIKDYNNFSKTVPAFRCNIKIFNSQGGYSSYQGEYPYNMIKKYGSFLSSSYVLTNSNASKNFLLLKNIFYLPTNEKFKLYLVDVNKGIVVHDFDLKANFSNIIDIEKDMINENYYFFSKKFIGIPNYLSMDDKNHLSFEHTLPPQSVIIGKNRFNIIKSLKEKINKIIIKNI